MRFPVVIPRQRRRPSPWVRTLRALPPVQKQFLLIGSDNRAKVLGWLKQFAASLELKTR